jgi:hypothetical protein
MEFRRVVSLTALTLLIAGCDPSPGLLDPSEGGAEPTFNITSASVLAAVPVAVDFGDAATIGTVRLSVQRGLVQSGIFTVDVTVTDDHGTSTNRVVNLSDTQLFGTDQSRAVVGVDFGSTVGIPSGSTLDVCAFVTQTLGTGERIISQTVCSTLDPQ